ncbi:MAG: lipid A export permease/ATP-binding protein MsbA [Pseudomonadota bacterium]
MSVSTSAPSTASVYRRLLAYALAHRGVLIAAVFANLLYAGTDSGFAFLIKPLLDGSFAERDGSVVALIPAAVLGLFALRGVAGFVGEYCMNWVSRQVITRLREEVLGHYLRMSCGGYDRSSAGELLSRLTYNIEQVAHSATKTLAVLVRDTLTIVGLFALMLYLSALLTLFIAVVAPLIGLVIVWVGKRFRRYNKRIQESMGSVTRVAEEVISAHRVIKIFNSQAREAERFARASHLNRKLHMRLVVAQGASDAVIMMLAAIGVASIIFVATLETMDITAGSFAAFLGAMTLMMAPLKRLTSLNANLQQGIAAGENIFSLLDSPLEGEGGDLRVERARGEVSLEGVGFAYDPSKGYVLRDINLQIEAGETVAFVGRSGAGKTSLVSLLPRFYDVSEGRITLDGHALGDYALDSLRDQIALVSQDVTLFNDTIAANIAYGAPRSVSPQELDAVARAAHVSEFAQALPEGLQTMVGDRGVLLSGGQRQRISIARALLKGAPILILDEATSALDTQSEHHIRAALDTLVRGRTTLVIAHRLSTIENADRIVVLHEGMVVEQGTHSSLLAQNGHYASLHQLQRSQSELTASAGGAVKTTVSPSTS